MCCIKKFKSPFLNFSQAPSHCSDNNPPTRLQLLASSQMFKDSQAREYFPEVSSEKKDSNEQTQPQYPPTAPPPYHPSPLPAQSPSRSWPAPQITIVSPSPDPAPSFSRQPSPFVPYTPFPVMYLTSKKRHLDKGFPLLPPPTPVTPHPFVTHDVNEVDWHRFLNEVQKAGKLTGREQLEAAAVPITTHMSILGVFATSAIESNMKDKKVIPVGELIDTWNRLFFHPRKMEVMLAKGQLDGIGNASIPKGPQRRPSTSSSSSSSSGSLSSSSKSGNPCTSKTRKDERAERKMQRESRRAERKEKKASRRREKEQFKAERKQTKAEAKGNKKYRLLVVACQESAPRN